ncbi:MAG: hypothetical protein WCE90_03770 [Candidatus Zixiibacteriota bacterium]
MIKRVFCLMLAGVGSLLSTACFAQQLKPIVQTEYSLERPAWGMIEWNSATLPKGFWYGTFEYAYLYNDSRFSTGKEVEYPGGRDSTANLIAGKLLYGVSNKLTLGVEIPVVLSQKVDSGLYQSTAKVKSGVSNLGDMQLFLKYHIWDRYFWSLSAEAGPTLPTGQPHNKVSFKQAATGDGQTDLNLALKGDILLNEDAFVKLGIGYVYQFRREYRNDKGDLTKEKLGDVLRTEMGFARNFRSVGIGAGLEYANWQATKQDGLVVAEQADLLTLSFLLSLGEISPQKHGKLDLFVNLPITGKNSAVTYRIGVALKTIFRRD